MKKKIVMALSLCLCLSALATALPTYSYLQDVDRKTNVHTVGDSNCQLNDSFSKPSTYLEGTIINRTVSVTNTGSVPCYIRVYVNPSYQHNRFRFNFDTTNWTKSGDWYYYNSPVSVGGTTSNLFSKITLLENMSDWSSDDTKIVIYAESIQSSGASNSISAFN